MIIGGKHRFQLSCDDYVVGALLLYMDIIQLFMYLLMLLGKKWLKNDLRIIEIINL
jgi:FtsH-binding integral membrane protein